MRIVSARSVVPVDRPPVVEGALALDDDGTIRMVGPRAAVRAEFSAAPEERAEGVLVPGLVNAHCHLELSALAGRRPGRRAASSPGRSASSRPSARRRGAPARRRARGSGRGGPPGHRGHRRRRQHARRRAGHRRGAASAASSSTSSLGSREAKTGDALADAARERAQVDAETEAGWPAHLGYVRAPHAPYSVGPELMRRIFTAASAEKRATSIHVAEDEEELKLLRDGTRRLARDAAGDGRRRRRPGRPESRRSDYLASLGAFDGGAPPLLVHMVHASERRPAPRPRGRRDRRALPPLEPPHRRPARRRPRACSPRASPSRSEPTASPRPPTSRCGARWPRWPATSPPCLRRAGWRRRPWAAPGRSAFPPTGRWRPASAPACSTSSSTILLRRSSRWSAIQTRRSAG